MKEANHWVSFSCTFTPAHALHRNGWSEQPMNHGNNQGATRHQARKTRASQAFTNVPLLTCPVQIHHARPARLHIQLHSSKHRLHQHDSPHLPRYLTTMYWFTNVTPHTLHSRSRPLSLRLGKRGVWAGRGGAWWARMKRLGLAGQGAAFAKHKQPAAIYQGAAERVWHCKTSKAHSLDWLEPRSEAEAEQRVLAQPAVQHRVVG